MAKRIKGALVIVFVLVLSCLLLIGCLFTLEVKGDRIKQSNLENKADSNFQLSADKEIILEGDTTDMATKWNEAIVYSKSNGGANVNVVLKNDWIATSTGEGTTFGSYADSFISGAILISKGATITLDLQGHTIDRKLTKPTSNGLVLFVEGGTLTIKDSSYSDSDLLNIYERLRYKPFEKIMATIRSELKIGNITGGAAASTGGGIHLIDGGKLNFESGMIADNIYAPTGGGIYAYPNCVVNISGGLIAANKSATNGGGVFINGGELNITGGLIIGNTAKSFGGGIYGRANAIINIENGIIANNYAEVRGGGINVEGGTLNLNDGIIARNEANIDAGGVYVAKDTTVEGVFNMNGGEISNNKSNFGGGVYLYNEAQAVINNGVIKENISYGNSAGMIIYSGSICTINNVQIIDNKVYRNIENSYSGGAGCMVAVSSQLIFNGGLIANNKIVEDNTSSQVNGGGILLANSSTTQPVVLTVNGGTITGNSALHYGGGIYDATGVSEINISGNAQIYGNTANGEVSDIHINKGRSININGKLGDTAHIGIRLAGDYGEEVFTNGY
ncbi:MAG: hypothetical protein K2P12_00545, partial [Clostridia bacterium]|nr:hypothetical protein [Clostridia bacterium]